MFRRFTHKRSLVALSVVAMLVVAGAAIAYFTSSGSGAGNASVGSSTAFTVAVSSDSSGSLYPGAGTETLTYSVHNPSAGAQNLSATSTAVADDGSGNITDGGHSVPGCLSSWFHTVNTAPTPLPQDLAGGATSTGGSVVVSMTDSASNQDPCQGHHPDITVSAS